MSHKKLMQQIEEIVGGKNDVAVILATTTKAGAITSVVIHPQDEEWKTKALLVAATLAISKKYDEEFPAVNTAEFN